MTTDRGARPACGRRRRRMQVRQLAHAARADSHGRRGQRCWGPCVQPCAHRRCDRRRSIPETVDRCPVGRCHDPAKGAAAVGVEPGTVPPHAQIRLLSHFFGEGDVAHDTEHQAEEAAGRLVVQLRERRLIASPRPAQQLAGLGRSWRDRVRRLPGHRNVPGGGGHTTNYGPARHIAQGLSKVELTAVRAVCA